MPTAIAHEKRQKSLKDRKRELYREAVLDAAERVFGEEGYEATKVQRIAAESGLSLTTLYSVFESKWEIYRAVHRRRLNEVMQLAQEVVARETSPLETLIDGTRMQLRFFMDRRDYTKMQLKEVTAWSTIELLQSPEQVEGLGMGLAQFASLFRQGIEAGDFVDEDPELMARMVIACQQVRLAMWMDGDCKDDPERVVDAALRHLLRSYCRLERLSAALAAAGLGADA
ncbi:MAG: TetR/AcrR family transcriptional regulator [Polyangiales bacterium]